jgi:putative flippase GtrA
LEKLVTTHLLKKLADLFALPVRAVCFAFVGCVGLTTDMSVFTALHMAQLDPLLARTVSLLVATVVTWQLNRNLTFTQNSNMVREAGRYALVTVCAQGVSYLTFASLLLMNENILPQLAVFIGAVAGTLFSFHGHSAFSFAVRQHRR